MPPERQLSFLVDDPPVRPSQDLAEVVPGFWSAGERLVQVNGQIVFANVWFHFAAGGRALLSVRECDAPRARSSLGTWSLVGAMLVAEFGEKVISAPLVVDPGADVLRWAGEVLHRLPHDAPTDESC